MCEVCVMGLNLNPSQSSIFNAAAIIIFIIILSSSSSSSLLLLFWGRTCYVQILSALNLP
jgi:hypothetical protein